MFGQEIIIRSMSELRLKDSKGRVWQYHSRSDKHSKIKCWSIPFDLMQQCELLNKHIKDGKVGFGINHKMVNFQLNKEKDLDLVICRPSSNSELARYTFSDLITRYDIKLDPVQQKIFDDLPTLNSVPVGSVLIALEAKACMTAHQKALPRLCAELNDSHLTIHGASANAVAGGLVMINSATEFLSPGRQQLGSPPAWNTHRQPKSVEITMNAVKGLPRRTKPGDSGFDALGIVVVDCRNDLSPISVGNPRPAPSEIFHYDQMIERMSNSYSTRFSHL